MKAFPRLFIKLILVVVFTFGILSTVYAAGPPLYGDVNDTGTITSKDALQVLFHVAKLSELDETQLKMADITNDGLVSIEDAREILLCSAQLSVSFRFDEFEASGTIWIAADSIAEGGGSYVGWGQVVDNYLTPDAKVNNTALSGRTAKSFIKEANYTKIMENMKAGDVLFIAFGHNDSKGGASAFESSDTEGSYKHYLKYYYIEPALRKGVLPILMTSVARCYRIDEGENVQYHIDFIRAARSLAEEYHEKGIDLPFIDMFNYTFEEYTYMGKALSRVTYHARDDVHYNEYGANWCAKLILHNVQKNGWDFARFINGEIEDPRECIK